MSSNYANIAVLQIDKPVIPFEQYEKFFVLDEYGYFDGIYVNGFDIEKHPLYSDFKKANQFKKEYGLGCFCYPERLYGSDWYYLKQQWYKYYQNDGFDINAMFKIDEEFLLNSGLFSDENLSQNMNWIDTFKEKGYTVYFYCA